MLPPAPAIVTRLLTDYAIPVLATALAALLRYALDPTPGGHIPLLLFAPAVLLSAWHGGWWPGLLATVLSVALNLTAAGPLDPTAAATLWARPQPLLFAALGVLTSGLCESLHAARRRAEAEARAMAEEQSELRTEAAALRRAASHSRISERRFQLLADAMPQMVWTALPDGNKDYFNRRWLDYTGLTTEASRGWGWRRCVHPDDLPRAEERWRASLRHGTDYEAEYRVRRAADGAYRWHLVRAVAVRDAADRLVKWLGTSTDVDDQKRSREILQVSEERYRTLLRSSPLPAVLWEPDGTVLEWNPAAERVFGWPAAEAVGRLGLAALAVPAGGDGLKAAVADLPAGRDYLCHLAPGRTRDGREVWCEWHHAAVRDAAGGFRWGLSLAQDVTERRRSEEERRRLEAQLQHTQKLDSLGVLAGGIAHDFNNLLMGVLGYTNLALLDLPPQSSARDSLRQVETAALRAAELTKQMLAYSGKGRFVIQALDLSDLAEEMLQMLRVSAATDADLRREFTAGLPRIEGDATEIRQLLMNLLLNAAEALGEEGGRITVRTGAQQADAAYLRGAVLDDGLPAGSYVFVEVVDTGCGMDEATRVKMFDPFFTTKFTGRGLGLAAVLGIVRGHRGAIHVDSAVGVGTTVRVLFPATSPAPAPEAAPAAAPAPGPWRGEGLVLVADDEETVRNLAKKILESGGFRVVAAADGLEALEVFRLHQEEIVAVLLDMTMPRLGGEDVYREMRQLRPDVRVLLSSGYSEQDATSRFAGAGLAGFLQKPYRPSELLQKMREIIGEK